MFIKHMRHIVSGAKSRRRTVKRHMKHTGGKKTGGKKTGGKKTGRKNTVRRVRKSFK